MRNTETNLYKKIQIWCSEQDWLCFHINVIRGQWKNMKNGIVSWLDTGVPEGWSDLIVLTDKGQTIFCEAKVGKNKPTKDQLKFIKIMRERGFLAFVAYSLEEFIENVKNVV